MIYKTFKEWAAGLWLEDGEPRKQAYTREELLLIEMGWNYGKDAGAAAEREKYYELLEEIKVWREAYPLSIFPVPDWEKVLDALTMNGLTLDAISASNLRHAANRFYEMLDETIRARGNK